MAVDREYMQKQLVVYQQQHQQMIANANALSGAIQAIETLLKEYDLPGKPVAAEPVPAKKRSTP